MEEALVFPACCVARAALRSLWPPHLSSGSLVPLPWSLLDSQGPLLPLSSLGSNFANSRPGPLSVSAVLQCPVPAFLETLPLRTVTAAWLLCCLCCLDNVFCVHTGL